MFAWCAEGRHEGTTPKYSKPCKGVDAYGRKCDCPCHMKETK